MNDAACSCCVCHVMDHFVPGQTGGYDNAQWMEKCMTFLIQICFLRPVMAGLENSVSVRFPYLLFDFMMGLADRSYNVMQEEKQAFDAATYSVHQVHFKLLTWCLLRLRNQMIGAHVSNHT